MKCLVDHICVELKEITSARIAEEMGKTKEHAKRPEKVWMNIQRNRFIQDRQ